MIYDAGNAYFSSKTAVIFVHGFNTNSTKTWGLDKTYYFWPFQIGCSTNSDVYCVEYLNNAIKNSFRSALDIDSLADVIIDKLYKLSSKYTEILFVTHSFGGVLVKHVYTKISQHRDPGIEIIKSKIRGIFMISCPHRGHILAYGIRAMFWMIMTRNFQLMGSRLMNTIHEEFLQIYARSKSHLMCETVGESGFLYHIFRVNPNDARLDTSTPHRVDERNHSQICKYIRDDDDIFGYIVEFIRKIRNNAIPIDELNGPLWKK